MRPGATLTFVTRRNCSLCDEAQDRLLPAAERSGVAVEVVDVDSDPDLQARYGDVVPVILSSSGRVLAAGAIGELRARRAVWRARLGRAG